MNYSVVSKLLLEYGSPLSLYEKINWTPFSHVTEDRREPWRFGSQTLIGSWGLTRHVDKLIDTQEYRILLKMLNFDPKICSNNFGSILSLAMRLQFWSRCLLSFLWVERRKLLSHITRRTSARIELTVIVRSSL